MGKTYKVLVKSITGVQGRIMNAGEEVPESFLLNIDEHVAAAHIEEIVTASAPIAEPAPSNKKAK